MAGTEDKPQNAIALLKADHRTVEALFEKYEKANSAQQKTQLAKQVCTELIVHTKLEEEIFYPACKGHVDDHMLDEAQVEHDGAKLLIRELLSGAPSDPFYDSKVTVLSEQIKHHVREEEKRGEGIFAKAKESGVDLDALGARLLTRKQELTSEAASQAPRPSAIKSFQALPKTTHSMQEEQDMPRQSTPDRDERGRFTSDDDDDRGRRRSQQSRSRDDDDDDRRSSRARSSREDDDDDRRSSRGRGQGGWFGDSEGHSQAARQRWDEEGGSRSRSTRSRDDDDDDRRSSRARSSRDEDDDDRRSSRGRGQGGWFGDSEGHAQAARQRWDEEGGSRSSRSRDDDDDDRRSSRTRSSREDDDDRRSPRGRGQGGWFGDSEGHAEAARQRWEENGNSSRSRSRGRDDDDGDNGRSRRASSRNDDDDDRRSSRGRAQGGWFGDPEGHAEASRRGWRDRD